MSEPQRLHTTRVDLSGLMTVLGNNLYSTPLVAVRELVQNAHDACVRRRIEDPCGSGPAVSRDASPRKFAGGRERTGPGAAAEPAIRVRVDGAAGALTVEDRGAGLTESEIVRYLATVGTGMTRELRSRSVGDDAANDDPSQDLIGMFGLGFLSAFVVGDRVVVTTTSYQTPTEGHRYQSVTGETYTLEKCPPRDVGTVVEIRLKASFRALASEDALRSVLEKYCALLTIPVFVGDDTVAINAEKPPWRSEDSNPLRARKLRFSFAERMEKRFAPLATIPVAPADDGSTDVAGVLWLQDGATYGTSDNRALTVYVRGMMLDDDGRDLLPAWAGFVAGAVESRRLVPTASREDLQKDALFAATAAHIEASLVRGLATLSKEEPETWRRVLLRHNEALLGAALASPALFDLLADELTVPTSEGDLPIKRLLKRGDGTVYVSLSEHGGFEEMLFRALQTPVATGTRYAVYRFALRYTERRGGRVVRLGTEEGNEELFERVSTLTSEQRVLLDALFGVSGQEIVAARFAPRSLPFVLVPDRDAELKARLESDEAAKKIASAALGLARLYTRTIQATVKTRLFVNCDCPPIARLLASPVGWDAEAPPLILLRSLIPLLAGAGMPSDGKQLGDALTAFTATVDALLPSAQPNATRRH